MERQTTLWEELDATDGVAPGFTLFCGNGREVERPVRVRSLALVAPRRNGVRVRAAKCQPNVAVRCRGSLPLRPDMPMLAAAVAEALVAVKRAEKQAVGAATVEPVGGYGRSVDGGNEGDL
jgi:hypothetical protein